MSPRILRDAAAVLATLLACARPPDPVEWGEARPLSPALAAAAILAFDANDSLRALPAPTRTAPSAPGQCAGSVRVVRDERSGQSYAVWWEERGDATADLVVAHSSDGITWGPAVRVDTLDAGRVACRRPPPSIASDGDNVYVAYAMAAREGPGIFASQSMDHGLTFHAPVAVVYGGNIGRSAIAARGNTVVVAYEDPNSNPQRVALAFSRTMGHPFDSRTIVSPATGAASDPRVVLGARTIAVVWQQGDSIAPGSLLMRTGLIR